MIPFSGFKKIKEDNHSAILQHPEGHHIVVAKTALNEQLKKHLAKLPIHAAEGMDIPDAPNQAPQPTLLNSDNQSQPFTLAGMLGRDANAPAVPQPAIATTQGQSGTPLSVNVPQNYQLSNNAQEPTQSPLLPMMGVEDYQRNIEKEKAGINLQAQAESALGSNQARAAAATAAQMEDLKNQYQNQSQSLMDDYNKLKQDYQNGHIAPQHYMESMDTGKKISTAIGLLLGGIGGAFTGQGNPALQFMNAQIDRDIQAQHANLGKTDTLLSANLKAQGNLRDAMDLTRAQLLGINAVKFQQAAAQAQDPAAKARGMQMSAQLDRQQAFPTLNQLALRQTLLGGNSQTAQNGMPSSNQVNQSQKTQVPLAIKARFLAPDQETGKSALNEIKQQENIDSINKNAMDSFDRVSQMQTLGNRTVNPIQSQKQIDAEWEPMLDKITKTNEGRVTPITVDLMNALKPQLTDSAETTKIKRQKLYNMLNSERSTPTLVSMGLNYPKAVGQTRGGIPSMSGFNPMGGR